MVTPDQCLAILEDTAGLLKKAQINLKKCPKQRLTKGYIEIRMQTIDDYWNTLKGAHKDLVKCIPKEKKADYSYFVNEDYYIYEELYLCIRSDLRDLLFEVTRARENDCNLSSESTSEQVRLPKINLPIFTGSYEEWPSFKDLFLNLVHKNTSLSDVQKLHYLKSSLAGEAESLLKHIQVIGCNYETAWSTLQTRYGNKRIIVNSLFKKLFNQKKIPFQTANHIKSLLDTTSECLNGLKNLNISTDSWDPIIIYLLVQKLDPESHRDWEQYAYKDDSEELPTWSELTKFLQTKFRTLELIAPPSREKPKVKEYAVHASTSDGVKQRICIMCQEDHTLCHCKEFTKMEPAERCDYVRNHNLCFNCLAPGHNAKYCRLNMSCRICHRRHHTLVHTNMPKALTNQPDNAQSNHTKLEDHDSSDITESIEPNVELLSNFTANPSTALLATALVPVCDEKGCTTILRALIDQGSQATFISERAAQALRLKRKPINGTITGIGSTRSAVKHSTIINLLSMHDSSFKLKVNAYVMSTPITSQLPSQEISSSSWLHLNGLVLADPDFSKPRRVDMLLGVEVYAQILKNELIRGPVGSPCAQNTSLGWILFGNVQKDTQKREIIVLHQNLELDTLLKSMWELDQNEEKTLTPDERKCEEIYQSSYTRTSKGRYILKLPTRTDKLLSTQGDTRDIAHKRLWQLERRFERNQHLKEEYTKVIEEYKTLGHMEELAPEDIMNPAVYLPHHAVVREEKETSKIRVVFNASQKGKNNVSLNDELLIGPQLQEDMRSLIMRWRTKRICFVADIEKMYRQILVTTEDKDLQRVLWRSDKNEPIKDYRLTRVTFGTASAPYLAVRTLLQVAEDEAKDRLETKRIIKEDFYMDDLMSGKDTIEEATLLANDIKETLFRGGFVLQKWCSNSAEFLGQFPPSQRSSHVNLDITINGTVRALGVSWNMGTDTFQFKLNLPPQSKSTTKRTILADVQRFFDPLGWLAPSMLPAKLLIQQLWLKGIGWDEEVDTSIQKEWTELRENMQYIENVQVDRWLYTMESAIEDVTVHGFCDASIKAYAAVAYIRVQNKDGTVNTGIIAAKTRVAPIKPLSLPRLELCGAVLLSRLLKQIRQAIRIPADQIFAWTDSTIVLSWLLGDPIRWNTFVRNRVVEILDNIGNSCWYHVQTQHNPADVASRGKLPKDLKEDVTWWKGPEWLAYGKIDFIRPDNITTDLDKNTILQSNLKIDTEPSNSRPTFIDQLEHFERLTELLKVVIYCKRFLKGRNQRDKDTPMTTEELEASMNTCVKIFQGSRFKDELNKLTENKPVPAKSKLRSLQPYLDKEQILRVGGRLRHAKLEEESKHPIILDGKDHLALLIVDDAHRRTLHGGVQLMLGFIRTKFWILRAKNLVKARIHKCLICAKHSASSKGQLMGDLPLVRVTPARPFLHSGVDYAGPYQILMSKGRGVKTNKAYVAIFVCMSTKAIHLELAGDLTTESFIGAFRRFVARRGKCAHLWSDQGRNFVGASKELVDAWNEVKLKFEGHIADTLALDGTQWHFNPAYSPHMGGLWEAGVKSLKHHMKRILTSNLTFEEMCTLLCEIEACLNSRPLSLIDGSDTDNIVPLTPGHFLIGEAPVTVPRSDLQNVPISHLSRWQHMQKLLSDFWRRWHCEYLTTLQQRPKWLKANKEFDIGSIVLIKNEMLPPGKWALGRIIDKHPGADGVTRVYSVKTGSSISQRAVSKLCPLPIDIE